MKQGMHGVTLQEKPLSAYVEVIQIADKAQETSFSSHMLLSNTSGLPLHEPFGVPSHDN